jgi:hypothetical protein
VKNPTRWLRGRHFRPVHALATVGIIALAALCLAAETTPASTAGFTAKITNTTNTAATAPYFTCSDMTAVNKSSALFQYNLDEPTGSAIATDRSGHAANGTYQGSMTTSTTPPLACQHDSGGAYVLDGSTSYISTPTAYTNPTTFSLEVWFKTSVAAGTLINFGNTQTGTSTSFDRVLYLTTAGKLAFGTYGGGTKFQILTSPNVVSNGTWHQVVATMSPTTGTNVYLDGSLAVSNASYTTAQNYTGYWRIGNQSLAKQPVVVPPTATQWTGSANTGYFTGSMRFAAVYSTALTAQQISNHYGAGR